MARNVLDRFNVRVVGSGDRVLVLGHGIGTEGSCRHSSMTTAWCCMTWPAPAASTRTHSTRTGTPPSCRMYSRHNTNCPLHLRRPLDVRNDRDSRLRSPPSAFHQANPHRCHCQVINYFFEINLIESIANPATF